MSLFIVCCHSWLSDLQFFKRTSCQVHKLACIWERRLIQENMKVCGELLNSRNSKVKSYQNTIVFITSGWAWRLMLGSNSSKGSCPQLRHLHQKTQNLANLKTDRQNDWLVPVWLTVCQLIVTDWLLDGQLQYLHVIKRLT